MSKGSKIVPVRMPEEQHAALLRELERYNANPLNTQLTVSEWIRIAIADKISHATRGRVKSRGSEKKTSKKPQCVTPLQSAVNSRLADFLTDVHK